MKIIAKFDLVDDEDDINELITKTNGKVICCNNSIIVEYEDEITRKIMQQKHTIRIFNCNVNIPIITVTKNMFNAIRLFYLDNSNIILQSTQGNVLISGLSHIIVSTNKVKLPIIKLSIGSGNAITGHTKYSYVTNDLARTTEMMSEYIEYIQKMFRISSVPIDIMNNFISDIRGIKQDEIDWLYLFTEKENITNRLFYTHTIFNYEIDIEEVSFYNFLKENYPKIQERIEKENSICFNVSNLGSEFVEVENIEEKDKILENLQEDTLDLFENMLGL